jgi:ribokinase
MAEQPMILVIGSANMDLVVRANDMPAPGQTVLGSGFVSSPGGKGANQAVAAARLGGRCRFIGRVGDDSFGQVLLTNMKAEGVDCTDLIITPGAPTGVAMIVVDAKGENAIVVAGGANRRLTPDDIFDRAEVFKAASIVLLQLELPLPTVRAAIDLARRHGCKTILDPAPALKSMPDELMHVDVISPNVHEAETITGTKAIEERVDKNVASDLIARGASAAVLKLGSRGSLVVMADGHFYRVPAYKVPVVDTTAAGDAFTAAFAVSIADGRNYHEAAKFANAAGALACTKLGAQSAMPTADEVRMLMTDQPI